MIKSKILYALCIAALGLPFAETTDGVKASSLTDKKPTSLDKRLTNKNIHYSTKVINQFNNSLNNNDRNQLSDALNSQIKNSQQLNALSQSVYDSTKEDVHNDKTIKKKANELLNAISNPNYDKNAREKLENELQALGVCRKSKWLRYGNNLLNIQLSAFLNPRKYEKRKRNDYGELVADVAIGGQLTSQEKKALEYMISVGGDNDEIVATLENIFMHTINPGTVTNYRDDKRAVREIIYKGVFCEESFNEIATTLELTELEKNRLIRSIRGYKKNILELVAFLSMSGYRSKYILSTLKKLYDKDYTEEIIDLIVEALSFWADIHSENLAKELNALWTCHTSVDSEEDREKCEIVQKLLKDCGFEVQEDDYLIYNTNYQQDVTTDQINTQSQGNGGYMFNDQNNYINNNVIEFDDNNNNFNNDWNYVFEENYNNNLQMNVDDNNNVNYQQNMANNQAYTQSQGNGGYMYNDHNDYINNNVIEFNNYNNNFNNDWNYGVEVNYNNNLIYNPNYQQGVTTDQIHTQSQGNAENMDNGNIETEDKYDSLEFEEETGFMQKEYY